MPLVANTELPSFQRLRDEGQEVLTPGRAKNQDIRELKKILEEKRLTQLISYRVSKEVNSTRNNDSSVLDPID